MRKPDKLRIGMRTVKTTAAVILSMIIVNFFGTTASKMIFAMMGAMAAVQPTFKDSLESCLSQIVGVLLGALAGVALRALNLTPLLSTAIGIVLIITFFNSFHIRFSPTLPCFILVMVCVTPDIAPMGYAIGRIWDTAIGLSVGMVINTLVFPYDNSRQIRSTVGSLNREVISFLEELLDGDPILPDSEKMFRKIDEFARELTIFSNQKLFLRLRRQRQQLQTFRLCEGKARQLLSHMEVLCHLEAPGILSEKNREALIECDASIRDERILREPTDADIVTNYHVAQILQLRTELLRALTEE